MKRVLINVTVEREIMMTEEEWKKDFNEELPQDMEDVNRLKDEALTVQDEFVKAEYKGNI